MCVVSEKTHVYVVFKNCLIQYFARMVLCECLCIKATQCNAQTLTYIYMHFCMCTK